CAGARPGGVGPAPGRRGPGNPRRRGPPGPPRCRCRAFRDRGAGRRHRHDLAGDDVKRTRHRVTTPALTGAGAAPTSPDRPMWPLFLGLAAAILAADRLAKLWLTSFLGPGESVDVL